MAETPIDPSADPLSEAGGEESQVLPRGRGKTRKERIYGKSQDRVRQDILEERSIDEAIRESIRLHGA